MPRTLLLDANTPTRAPATNPFSSLSAALPCSALAGCPPLVSRFELERRLILGGYHYDSSSNGMSSDYCVETRHYHLKQPTANQPSTVHARFERGMCTALTLVCTHPTHEEALARYREVTRCFAQALVPLTPLIIQLNPQEPPQSHTWEIPHCKKGVVHLCIFLDPLDPCVQIRLTA